MNKYTGNRYFFTLAVTFFAAVCLSVMLSGCAVSQTQFISVSSVPETADDSHSDEETSLMADTESNSEGSAEDTSGGSKTGTSTGIYVYVCGKVKHPGVYELREEARVYEAVEAAGGFTDEASEESVNQARLLTDGEELYVPGKEDAQSLSMQDTGAGSASGTLTGNQDGKININTADAATLTTLTGIGETKAASIIAWREENGAFSSIEDIKKVDGIADKTYEKIKDEITVN